MNRSPQALWSDELGCAVIVCPVDQWGHDAGRQVARVLAEFRALESIPAALERAKARSAAGLLRKAVDDAERKRAQAGHKWCPKCGSTKPLEEFRKDLKRCTDCHNQGERERKRKLAEEKRRAAESERVDPQARQAA